MPRRLWVAFSADNCRRASCGKLVPPAPPSPLCPLNSMCTFAAQHVSFGVVKGSWTAEEDKLIAELVARGLNWARVAQLVPGRNRKQCRERWCNHLDPVLTKRRWTPEEDSVVIALQRELGNKWARISNQMVGRCVCKPAAPAPHAPRALSMPWLLARRSENDVKNRWNSRLRSLTSDEVAALPHPKLFAAPPPAPAPAAECVVANDDESEEESESSEADSEEQGIGCAATPTPSEKQVLST